MSTTPPVIDTVTEHEVAECNATGRTPVVFIHGLWLLREQLGPVGQALRGQRVCRVDARLAGRPGNRR